MIARPIAKSLAGPLARPLGTSGSGYDPDAKAWFTRVLANGGTLSSPGYDEVTTKRKLSDFFVALKREGVFSQLIELGILVGVGNLSGIVVKPLYLTSPIATNLNFVSGDYKSTGSALGLKGTGVASLNLGTNTQLLPQDDISMGLYVTSGVVPNGSIQGLLGSVANTGGTMQIFVGTAPDISVRNRSSNVDVIFPEAFTSGIVGISRSGSASSTFVAGSNFGSNSRLSAGPVASSMALFGRGSANLSTAGISGYWFGVNCDLAKMKICFDNLMSSFGFNP